MNIYTDGSCTDNGKKNARAGIGIYFTENDPRNLSEELEGEYLTNNIAELTAILMVFKLLKKEIKSNTLINIYSDSEYSINSITKWYPDWVKKKTFDGKKNIELIKKIYKLFQKYQNVKLLYIKAHTGLKDEHSIGNENADTLAGEAINIRKFIYTDSKSKKNNKVNYDKTNNKKLNSEYSNEEQTNNYHFTFGKYKNKAAIWVKEQDPGYIEWCIDHLKNKQIVETLQNL